MGVTGFLGPRCPKIDSHRPQNGPWEALKSTPRTSPPKRRPGSPEIGHGKPRQARQIKVKSKSNQSQIKSQIEILFFYSILAKSDQIRSTPSPNSPQEAWESTPIVVGVASASSGVEAPPTTPPGYFDLTSQKCCIFTAF